MRFSISGLLLFCFLGSLGGMINTWEYHGVKLREHYHTYQSTKFGWPFTYRVDWSTAEPTAEYLDSSLAKEPVEDRSNSTRFLFWGMVKNFVFWALFAWIFSYVLMEVFRIPPDDADHSIERKL